MAGRLQLVGVMGGARLEMAAGLAELHVSGGELRLVHYGTRDTLHLELRAGQLPRDVGAGLQHTRNRINLSVDGVEGSVAAVALEAALAGADQGISVSGWLSRADVTMRNMVEMLVVDVGGRPLLVLARPEGQGLQVHDLADRGTPARLSQLADSAALPLGGVSALTAVQLGATVLVFAGSAREDGVAVLRLEANGQLVPLTVFGPESGVPINAVSALRMAEVAGEHYLIVAASGSSSLSVMRVEGTEGRLQATDQVIDTSDTRFQGVQHIDLLEARGITYVVAAGRDDGLSLFVLLPGGRLVHLDTLPDDRFSALENVSALRMVEIEGRLQIVTTSGAEAGVNVVEYVLPAQGVVLQGGASMTGSAGGDVLVAAPGTTTMDGGAGDDILMDAAGSQSLRGGAGRDIFVLVADGATDRILDFNPAEDRLDLGSWPMLRGHDQISFTSTQDGAVLVWRDERLEIVTETGRPLTLDEFRASMIGVELLHLDPAWIGEDGHVGVVPVTPEPPQPEPPVTPPVTPPTTPTTPDPGGGAKDLVLNGGPGAERLVGGAGNDTLRGGGGADTLEGGGGNDLLVAGTGTLLIDGGEGNDLIIIGPAASGAGVFQGGAGDDVFVIGTEADLPEQLASGGNATSAPVALSVVDVPEQDLTFAPTQVLSSASGDIAPASIRSASMPVSVAASALGGLTLSLSGGEHATLFGAGIAPGEVDLLW